VSSSWTQSDLDALEDAIKGGTKRVEYEDRSVTYRSLEEMMQLRKIMREELGHESDRQKRTFVTFSDGLD
jgi:hypothetical protein